MESHGAIILTGESRRNLRKICTSATLSNTNPTWTNPGLKIQDTFRAENGNTRFLRNVSVTRQNTIIVTNVIIPMKSIGHRLTWSFEI
jgi:hypothetical protein